MKLSRILTISRPRFWLYEAGTFALGVLAGWGTQSSLFFAIVFGLYFLIPANILIYGINDVFDYDTDTLNPIKVAYEALVPPSEHRSVYLWIICTTIPFLFAVPYLSIHALVSFCIFLFCAIFYSAKPIRAKARPVFDSFFSALHYVATGVFGYYLVGGVGIPFIGIIAGISWAVAMHAYSAVPDIEADTSAGLKTVATFLGTKYTLLLCGVLYLVSGMVTFTVFPYVASITTVVYLFLLYKSYKAKTSENLFTLYTYFPYINALVGMIIFFSLLFKIL